MKLFMTIALCCALHGSIFAMKDTIPSALANLDVRNYLTLQGVDPQHPTFGSNDAATQANIKEQLGMAEIAPETPMFSVHLLSFTEEDSPIPNSVIYSIPITALPLDGNGTLHVTENKAVAMKVPGRAGETKVLFSWLSPQKSKAIQKKIYEYLKKSK